MSDLGGGAAGAILLSLIGEDEAAALVGNLLPDEIAALCGAMESLAGVDEPQIESVLGDFIVRARAQNAVATAGSTPVRHAIERSLGTTRSRAILRAQGEDAEHPVFAQIGWLADDDVCDLVATEHLQVAAIIVSRVDAGLAARAVAALPDDEQADLLHRVATMGPIGTDALDDLARAIAERVSDPGVATVDLGGAARVAAILNRTERPAADKTLKALSRIDRLLAARIDDERVTFADVVALSDKDLGTVVRSSDAAMLARALKSTDAPTRDRFLAAMSTRAAQSLRDEIEELSSLPRAEVDAAQAAIVAVARRLGDEGSVRMSGAQADYV